MAHGRFPPCCFSACPLVRLGKAVPTKVSIAGGPRGRGHVTNGGIRYLHPPIIPPVIILPLPKTRTSNRTTMTVPMTIAKVLVLLVLLLLFTRHSPSA